MFSYIIVVSGARNDDHIIKLVMKKLELELPEPTKLITIFLFLGCIVIVPKKPLASNLSLSKAQKFWPEDYGDRPLSF